MENRPGKLIPALIGGGIMAVLSSIPLIEAGNCICCLWVLLGGAMAVWFYQKDLPQGEVMTGGDGAVIGLLAGLFGAVFTTLLKTMFMALGAALPFAEINDIIRQSEASIDPEAMDFMENMSGPFFTIFMLFMFLIADSIFGLLGGVIGVSLFRKKEQPKSVEEENHQL